MVLRSSTICPRVAGAAEPYPMFFPVLTVHRGVLYLFAMATMAWISSTVVGYIAADGVCSSSPCAIMIFVYDWSEAGSVLTRSAPSSARYS